MSTSAKRCFFFALFASWALIAIGLIAGLNAPMQVGVVIFEITVIVALAVFVTDLLVKWLEK